MKKFLSAIAILLICCQACTNTEKPSRSSVKNDTAAGKADTTKTLDVPWLSVVNDSTGQIELRKNPASDISNLQARDITDALNLKYPQIKLNLVGQEGDTAIINIADATYLTQQMGTAGAKTYLAELTFSLTEISGIKAVDIRFKEGDHASPKVYTRGSFRDLN